MNAKIELTLKELSNSKISDDRKAVLQPLIDFMQSKLNGNDVIRLHFICTHNSRRSHLAQIWAQTMAYYFGIKNVYCYSAGTEATALFPKVAETLQNQGFEILKLSNEANPIYAIKYDENEIPIIGFSKKLDHDFNPTSGFAAIMTCSSADEACPFVAGAEKRIPIKYDDPKTFDGTSLMDAKYAERSLEIAKEMWYVFKGLVHVPIC